MLDPLPTDNEYSQFEQDLEDIGGVERDSQAPSLSNVSFSTNATGSNLPGTGRVLGNVYEYVGLLLEIVICLIAYKAGLGPKTTYQKIQELRRTEWQTDEKQSALSIYYMCRSWL